MATTGQNQEPNVSKPRINHPCFDGLYHPLIGNIWGWFTIALVTLFQSCPLESSSPAHDEPAPLSGGLFQLEACAAAGGLGV